MTFASGHPFHHRPPTSILYQFAALLIFDFVASVQIDEKCMLQIKDKKFDFFRDPVWVNTTLTDLTVDFSLCRSDNQKRCGPYNLCLSHKMDNNLVKILHTADIESITYDEKILQVDYKSSEKNCKSDYFSVSLRILCDESCQEPILETEDECNLKIMWLCHHACLYKEETSSNCMLFTETQRFDFRALNDVILQAKVNNTFAQLSLCGNLKSSNCPTNTAFAFVKNSSCKPLSFDNDKKLILSSTKGLRMVFNQTFSKNEIFVNLKCVEDQVEPEFYFNKEDSGSFYFTLNSMLACPIQHSPCKIEVDQDHLIDLSPLRKRFDNWSIVKNKNKLIFNICSGLNYQNGFLCSGGTIGACMKTYDGSFINYGNKFEFRKHENGVYFSIYNGEKCGDGRYSLNISLIQSLDEKTPEIVQLSQCNLRVDWHTKYSLPVEYFSGLDCQIKPPLSVTYHQDLRFTELFKTDVRYDLDDGSNLRINLCSSLSERCGQDENASICYEDKSGNEIAVGFKSEPFSSDRSVQFVLEGRGCDSNNILSQIHFYMSCSYEKSEISLLRQDGCKFYFIWKTDKACLFNKTDEECSLSSGNEFYDLSPLSDTGDNRKIEIDPNTTLIFNICHNLVPEYQLFCPSTSLMCLKIKNHLTYKFNNIGGQRTLKLVEKNHLRIELKHYECSNYSYIDFYCSSETHETPSFQQNSNCSFHLQFHTVYACARSNVIISSDCTATDPHNGKTYSLTSLMSKQYEIDGFYVSICEPLKTSSCFNSSNICPINPPYISQGNFSSPITVLENSLMINYTRSIFYFICGNDVKPNKIHNVNNVNYLYWKTSQACLRKPICEAMKSLKFKLVESITVGEEVVVFSSCEQLDIGNLELPGKVKSLASCPGGSASCLITNSTIKSLGYPFLEPIVTENSVELIYPQGDFCNESKGLRYSTKITFICSKNKKHEKPFFKYLTHDCQYQFFWPTSLVCKNAEPVPIDCSTDELKKIYEHNNDLIFDNLYINLCEPQNKHCDGFICLKTDEIWQPFGNLRYHDYFVSENNIFLNFVSNSQDCSARLIIQCGEERSEIKWMEPHCGFEVVWYSPIPCKKSESAPLGSSSSSLWKQIFTFVFCFIGFIVLIKSRFFLWSLIPDVSFSGCNPCRRRQVDERTLLRNQSGEDDPVFDLRNFRNDDVDHWSWQV